MASLTQYFTLSIFDVLALLNVINIYKLPKIQQTNINLNIYKIY